MLRTPQTEALNEISSLTITITASKIEAMPAAKAVSVKAAPIIIAAQRATHRLLTDPGSLSIKLHLVQDFDVIVKADEAGHFADDGIGRVWISADGLSHEEFPKPGHWYIDRVCPRG